MKRLIFWGICLVLNLASLSSLKALERFTWGLNQTVVGTLRRHVVSKGETLLDIARWYDLGYNQIVLANPGVDPWVPPEGREIIIPTQYVLPEKRAGLVVNLAEMRLYFFRRELGQQVVYTAPIGVGVEGKLTELGVYTVIRKKKHPSWHVPKSIREEDPTLPEVVPPGPDNPLGDYALYLSRGAYAIHGTNRPWGIGRRVSHGCIRLYPEDIEALYPLVPIGTSVFIIYQPFKLGIRDKDLYLQVFPDFEKKIPDQRLEILRLANRLEQETNAKLILYWDQINLILKRENGIPGKVGKLRLRRR